MSEKYLSIVREALSKETFYGTPAILSTKDTLQTNLLEYPTLYEDAVIQTAIHKYKEDRASRNLAFKVLTTTASAALSFFGMNPFTRALEALDTGHAALDQLLNQLLDAGILDGATGAMTGWTAGTLATSILDKLDDEQLKELDLSWINTKQSYVFNCKSHRGDATTRLLKIVWNKQIQKHQTMFAIQFPDEYVVNLYPVHQLPIQAYLNRLGYNYDKNAFAVSEKCHSCQWVTSKRTLGHYTTDNGLDHPIELWEGKKETVMLVIKHQKPHSCIY